MTIKIISGGQTGADRAALDIALDLCLPCGGYCPKGRKAEDGWISEHYPLTELNSPNYIDRNKRNVIESDATVIFTHGNLSGGSEATAAFCRHHGKPYLHIDANEVDPDTAAQWIKQLITNYHATVLNVAGQRASKNPEAYNTTRQVLWRLLTT